MSFTQIKKKSKPTKLLLPIGGDTGELMDTESQVSSTHNEITASGPYSGLLNSIPIVLGII